MIAINRRRFLSDMEAAWELRPHTDETPGSSAHLNRFARPAAKQDVPGKNTKKTSPAEKNGENGS
ncbi:MAG: hypothetical protein LBH95_06675 [Oscillospiraceae bacterium]|jgi:hypothetical protein|nr:hypothetical protein [Oscillospiraceae bacterium]